MKYICLLAIFLLTVQVSRADKAKRLYKKAKEASQKFAVKASEGTGLQVQDRYPENGRQSG